jgi:diguanylate cyclase (GGDEF)-like protein/PAS domain S-box-containing protein
MANGKRQPREQVHFFAALLLGAAVCAVGLTIAIAWQVHATALIQLRPDHPPVQFNTALGLLAGGCGLIALTMAARRSARLFGALCLLLGVLTGTEYVFGTTLGIDEFFINAYLYVQSSTPGRMAPNTAACLALTGLALLGFASRNTAAIGLAGIAAMLAGALAVLAVAGYAANVPMAYGWFAYTRMALTTALAIAALNLALVWHCFIRWQARPMLRLCWRPTLIAAAMMLLTSAVWLSLLDAEHLRLQRAGKDEMAKFVARVALPAGNRIEALTLMKRRWEFRGATPRAEWEADAAALQEAPGFVRALEWVDRDRVIRWVVPLQGNQGALDQDMGADLGGLAALEAARYTRALTLTHVIGLAQGGDGFMAIQPVFKGARLDGFIVGVFAMRAMLDDAVRRSELAGGYAVQVFDGERSLYSWNDDGVPATDLVQEGEVAVHDIRWRVRIWPTAAYAARQASWLPWAVLGAGLIVAALLALITALIQLAEARARALRAEIGERIRAEQENVLLISELEVVFANVTVGIALIRDRHTVRCNLQYAEILGYQMEQVVGQPCEPNHPSEAIGVGMGVALDSVLAGGQSFTVDLELMRHNGSLFWAACFGKALDPYDIRKGTVWVLEDISGRKTAEEQLLFKSQHDALTGLANRAMLGDRLNMAINHAARHKHKMAVCYLDLDRFKFVNDTYGHETGDQLLLAVAQRLLSSVRDTDTVARLGGDEFAIVLSEGVDTEVVTTVLTRILENVGEPLVLNGHALVISGSLGVAMYPEHGLDAPTLLKNADEAMYRAKQGGRNNWRTYAATPADAPQ